MSTIKDSYSGGTEASKPKLAGGSWDGLGTGLLGCFQILYIIKQASAIQFTKLRKYSAPAKAPPYYKALWLPWLGASSVTCSVIPSCPFSRLETLNRWAKGGDLRTLVACFSFVLSYDLRTTLLISSKPGTLAAEIHVPALSWLVL